MYHHESHVIFLRVQVGAEDTAYLRHTKTKEYGEYLDSLAEEVNASPCF